CQLANLFLSHNDLTALSIRPSSSLQWLDLSHNKITKFSLKDLLQTCPQIKKINLSSNSIEDLQSDFSPKSLSLTELQLAGNKLTVPPKQLVKLRGQLKYLDLSGNPFMPSTEIVPTTEALLDWLEDPEKHPL